MAIGRQVTREASVYLIGFVFASLLQLLALPIYTRTLGPVNYASYSLTIALATAVAGVAAVGGDIALSRFWFTRDDPQERRDLAMSLILALTAWSVLLVGLLTMLLEPLSVWLSEDTDLPLYLLVALVGLVPAQLSRMLAQILRNEFRPLAFTFTTMLVGVLSVGLGLLLCVVLGYGVVGILLGTLIGETAGCLIRLPMVIRELRGRWSWALARGPIRFGLPFIPASIASWVFTGADRLVVGHFLNPEALGGYSVAAMVVAPFSVLLSALGQAWLPRISQLYEVDQTAAARAGAKAIELSLALYGAAAVVAGALANVAVAIIGGQGYAEGAKALPFLAVAAMFLGVSLFSGTGYTLARRTKLLPIITIAAAVLDAALLLILVPRLGVIGAALSVVGGYSALALGSLAYSQKHFPMPVNPWRVGAAIAVTVVNATVSTLAGPGALRWVVAALSLASLLVLGLGAARTRVPTPARAEAGLDGGVQRP